MRVLIGKDEPPHRRFTVRLLWEPRDIWIGVFWNQHQEEDSFWIYRFTFVYVCLIPCLPLAFIWQRRD